MVRCVAAWHASNRHLSTELNFTDGLAPIVCGGDETTLNRETSMATTINPSEISELIKHRIEEFKLSADARNEGTIVSVSDGIIRIHGLADVMSGEMIELPNNGTALALNLERDSVGAVVLGEYEYLTEGDTVKTTGRILEVPVGPELLGRVVDALGNPIDGKGPVNAKLTSPVEKVAPGVIARKSVSQPVQTGYKSVDSMIPIGRGQRELIIGDRQTGKTAVCIDAILNQKDNWKTGDPEKQVRCIYVAIGQKGSTIAAVRGTLEEAGALAYTTIVAAPASDAAGFKYLAPYTGSAIGQHWMYAGKHVLIVEDEPKIAEVLRKYLRAEGWGVTLLATGARAVETILQHRDDVLVVVDYENLGLHRYRDPSETISCALFAVILPSHS